MLRKSGALCLVDWGAALHICRRGSGTDVQEGLRFIEFVHNRAQTGGAGAFALDFDESGRIFAGHAAPMNELLAGLSSKISMIKK